MRRDVRALTPRNNPEGRYYPMKRHSLWEQCSSTTLPLGTVFPGDLRQEEEGLAKVFCFFFFITLGLELSDTKVYEP